MCWSLFVNGRDKSCDNLFSSPLHSVEFSEKILEAHEAEVLRLKKYLDDNQELFDKVCKRQEVWRRYMDLESRAKDPTRLMNSRGNSLLEEERERNSVNRALPRVEQELRELIVEYEIRNDCPFLIEGVSLDKLIVFALHPVSSSLGQFQCFHHPAEGRPCQPVGSGEDSQGQG